MRHDRPIRHQREVRRFDPAVHFRCRFLPAVPDRRAGALGGQDSDAGIGGGHDHGVHRHVQLGVYPQPAYAPLAVVGGDGGDRCGGGLDA
ncbi:hypothetical protein D3C72_2091450 [compost metagenome]